MLSRAESWAAIERIAASLGVRRDTRRKWRARGKVPGRWHLPILRKAREEGLQLELDSLTRFEPATAEGQPEGQRARPGRYARIDESGNLALPPEVVRQLGVEPGDHLVLAVEHGELRAWPLKTAIAEVQALVRQYVPDDVDLAEELIADRRREALAE